jgi:peptidoglycan hydrolase-like protein with peptidoglycan-binding domain
MLAQDPTIYPNPQITGYYGALTEAAVARFQQKYGIFTTPQTLGLAGPATRAKLNTLYANGLPIAKPISNPVAPTSQLQLLLRLLSR